MSYLKFSRGSVLANFIASVVLVLISLAVFNSRQLIIDQINVWQYEASTEITSLAERSGMSDNGKFLFYASKPQLDGTQDFNNECDRIENTTSILGCYNNFKIYVYDVIDTQLDGIREVTAAHEMLHAAYQRLGDSEKAKINSLLEAEYKKIENNSDYSDRMAFYARAEPGERANELHSIIGTEVGSVGQDLEKYYSQYFLNRQNVVDLYKKYSSVFVNLKNHANDLTVQMDALSKKVSDDTTQYNKDAVLFSSDVSSFNIRANNGDFSSQYQFNKERNALVARMNSLEEARISIDNNIKKYDALLDEYNSIASESKKLYNSIDSTLAPSPSI